MISYKDLILLLISILISCSATASAITTVAISPSTILDLPILVMLGACGASMLGGIVATLLAAHRAQIKNEHIVNIRLLLATNVGVALVLGIVTWGVSEVYFNWRPEALIGLLVLVGVAGELILLPILTILQKASETIANRIFGGNKG